MAINIHKSKENIDIEEALGVIWTSLQRNEDDFEKVSETIEKGVSQNITNILLEKNFINKEKNKIKLTASGEDLGKQLTRRHRLTACDLEHNLSTDLADSICTLLGHPKQCPHGNPIPEGNCCKNSSSKIESIVVPLSKIDIAEEVTLSYIVTTNHDYMHKLLSIGLVPGTKIKLHQKFPTYIVKVNETQIALDGEVANLIYVRK